MRHTLRAAPARRPATAESARSPVISILAVPLTWKLFSEWKQIRVIAGKITKIFL
jgi:hypothetical protein